MIADILTTQSLYAVPVSLFFLGLVLLESARVTWVHRANFTKNVWKSDKKQPNLLSKIYHTTSSLIIMQLGHSTGFIYQLFKRLFSTKNSW